MDYSKMEFKDVIARINELYNKSKTEGLSEEEKQEQAELRKYYISVFRGNFKANLSKVKKTGGKKPAKKRFH